MDSTPFNRRRFLRNTAATATGMFLLPYIPKETLAQDKAGSISTQGIIATIETRIRFSVIGINHGHIYGMADAIISAGGQMVSFYAKEAELVAAFAKRYPQTKAATGETEILEDKSIQLILSSIIPDERAPLGVRVMKHGKDYMVDKPGITTLAQLKEVRRIQKKTRRIYSVMCERFENRATVKAGDLVKAGSIGKVIQTIGLGPHQMTPQTRPEWFFDKKRFGGILTDLASHQFDQFLFFTGSTRAEIVASQTGNVNHPQYPKFEDFGDVMLKGNGGTGYIRVDWFTPGGLKAWGDGRLTILGTEGYIEIRKTIDIASSHTGGNHLYLVTQKETRYIDCSKEPLPYAELLVNDIVNRTETSTSQEHCFLAAELGLIAQKKAQAITPTQ